MIALLLFTHHSHTFGEMRSVSALIASMAIAVGLVFPSSALSGEALSIEPEYPLIDTIIVVDNQLTQPFVIISEMKLHPGMQANPEAIEHDRRRLESLGLFSRAEIMLESLDDNRTALIVRVTELWYVWPGIFLALNEEDPQRVSYGALLLHNNFRGRRELFSISARMGYASGIEIEWDIPYLTRDHSNLFLEFHARSMVEKEPLSLKNRENLRTEESAIMVVLGRRHNLENRSWLETEIISHGFSSETAGYDLSGLSATGDGRDWLASLQIGFERDTRYYRPWPSQGYVLQAKFGGGFSLDGPEISYLRPGLSLSGYRSLIDGFYLAGNVHGSATIGSVPVYRRFLIDREHNLRTGSNKRFEGIHQGYAKTELRMDLIDRTYLTFRTPPPLRDYTRNLKFGLSLAFFGDGGIVGGVDNPSPGPVSQDETGGWDMGYGLGIIFHVPYRDILRIEIARSARFPSDGILLRARLGSSF